MQQARGEDQRNDGSTTAVPGNHSVLGICRVSQYSDSVK